MSLACLIGDGACGAPAPASGFSEASLRAEGEGVIGRVRAQWKLTSSPLQRSLPPLPQLQSRRGFKLGDGLFRARDLDRGHAHFARGLQVDAEVVEIDAIAGID
ncbi:hypothetical protein V1282_003598 [Nitrobacteraceae bacterium AZCC 2146]